MRIESFLNSHGITQNPFSNGEEAQGDQIYLELLKRENFAFGHPSWAKFSGAPLGMQTSIMFGAKGSGKTAARLALSAAIQHHNQQFSDDQVWQVNYSDFDEYLANSKNYIDSVIVQQQTWRDKLANNPSSLTIEISDFYHLSHHIDAILSAIMLDLIARIEAQIELNSMNPAAWTKRDKYDLLLLFILYYPQYGEPYREAVTRLAGLLKPRSLLGFGAMGKGKSRFLLHKRCVKAARQGIRTLNRASNDLSWALRYIPTENLRGEPLLQGDKELWDESGRLSIRYAKLRRLLEIVTTSIGYARVVVVIDRVDEPVMVQGRDTQMNALISPLWDNQLLQMQGIYFKMLLSKQLLYCYQKGDQTLMNRARLDKANLIESLSWSGLSLCNMLSERIRACQKKNSDSASDLYDLFSPDIDRQAIITQIEQMKSPRFATKFMNFALTQACEMLVEHTDDDTQKPLISQQAFMMTQVKMTQQVEHYKRDMGE